MSILRRALDDAWRRLRKHWNRARREYCDDAVHDLRVASRRLLAVLDTLRSLVRDPKIEVCRRRVKKSIGALSPLRDVQVLRANVSRMERRYPALKDFQKSLQDKEEQIARRVRKLLEKGPKLGGVIAKAKKRAQNHVNKHSILETVDKRYDAVLRRAKEVNPADTATIHRFRLAFKRFRYTVEAVHQLIKKEMTEARLEQLHGFQTAMGEIQDIEVFSKSLLKWARRDEQRMAQLGPLREELDRQKRKAIEKFMNSIRQVYTFWKIPLRERGAKRRMKVAGPVNT